LQSMIEQGIFGLFLLLSMYAMLIVRAFKTKSFFPVAFIIYFIGCSITESLLFRNKGIVMFGLFVGLFLFSNWRKDKSTSVATLTDYP
jgi:O-antigen ligase